MMIADYRELIAFILIHNYNMYHCRNQHKKTQRCTDVAIQCCHIVVSTWIMANTGSYNIYGHNTVQSTWSIRQNQNDK